MPRGDDKGKERGREEENQGRKLDVGSKADREGRKKEANARIGIRIVQQTLYTRQDRRHVVGRTPPVLQNVKAELTVGVDVRVEHLAEEFDNWRFVRVRLVKGQDEAEGAVFEGGVG
jgi:hypothetical protein